jgi:hypothetical protein
MAAFELVTLPGGSARRDTAKSGLTAASIGRRAWPGFIWRPNGQRLKSITSMGIAPMTASAIFARRRSHKIKLIRQCGQITRQDSREFRGVRGQGNGVLALKLMARTVLSVVSPRPSGHLLGGIVLAKPT